MRKRIIKISIISFFALLFLSIILQFGFNMLFIDIYEPVMVKGGDSKLNTLLYESPQLPDSYFNNEEEISEKLEGAIERINQRDDCCDFTANHLIRFYLENKQFTVDEMKFVKTAILDADGMSSENKEALANKIIDYKRREPFNNEQRRFIMVRYNF